MKRLIQLSIYTLLIAIIGVGCSIDRKPESLFSDVDFWNTETDLVYATNKLYQQLDANWLDNRADDGINQNANSVSNGTRQIPNTSADWNDRYDEIFTANNILEKAVKAQVSDAIKNRYLGEARFFRAYAYLNLLQKYGDVPLLVKTLDFNSPELTMPRTPRAEVIAQIYEDLDFAAQWLPARSALPASQWGRVTKSAAYALKARAALYEGTRAKFHNTGEWQQHLQTAVTAAEAAMTQGNDLYPSYFGLFQPGADGAANKEAILVKIFGVNNTNVLLGHNYSRDLENGRYAITRNLIRQFLYTDGRPAWTTTNTPLSNPSSFYVPEANESSYNTIFENRDPRLATIVFKAGDTAYKGAWVPTTTLGSRTGYASKKGFNIPDWTINGAGTTDKMLIRYAEVLLIFAEAKYELTESISDADLDKSINRLRTRAGLNVKLTNAFVTANGLNMREEIRRERTVELALEGFRYDDLIRWKTAEILLPQNLLGAKYVAADWPGTAVGNLNLNSDAVIIAEPASARTFRPDRDYLYPVPINEITLSGGNVQQNPNWQ